jgi:L,D-peptidoglycan transpeptidase YkuD (ErfK/YbiS/YcfS/YnhG family)|tara:strand:+ start:6311 stop:6802 length:492 start_codon:yes stop_codon:yes gene_type:complete
MLITVKNKDTLIIDEFKFRCCIGKNGLTKNKLEGDKKTPKGIFKLGSVYYRKDRVKKPNTNLKIKIIKSNHGWCNDFKNKNYNKEIILSKNNKGEKIYRKDHKYDYFVQIKYNSPNAKPLKGSAIFLHLTKNFKPTAGCIAVDFNSMLIILKLLTLKSKIKIC